MATRRGKSKHANKRPRATVTALRSARHIIDAQAFRMGNLDEQLRTSRELQARTQNELDMMRKRPMWLVRDGEVTRLAPMTSLKDADILTAVHEIERAGTCQVPSFRAGTSKLSFRDLRPVEHPNYRALVDEATRRGLIGLHRSGDDSASELLQAASNQDAQ